MSAVDVLAYLRAVEREIPASSNFASRRAEALEACAAVAELIAAVREHEVEITNPVPCHVMRLQTRNAMFAALKRCGGSQ